MQANLASLRGKLCSLSLIFLPLAQNGRYVPHKVLKELLLDSDAATTKLLRQAGVFEEITRQLSRSRDERATPRVYIGGLDLQRCTMMESVQFEGNEVVPMPCGDRLLCQSRDGIVMFNDHTEWSTIPPCLLEVSATELVLTRHWRGRVVALLALDGTSSSQGAQGNVCALITQTRTRLLHTSPTCRAPSP